nr:unnamed protein product [Meloidogyne enterolobii]CAD2127137.1 unnamed protein product [Meloidogyne enterolobii]CAD2207279.1 unnamed protein product [Meloidogyne enterolobii]
MAEEDVDDLLEEAFKSIDEAEKNGKTMSDVIMKKAKDVGVKVPDAKRKHSRSRSGSRDRKRRRSRSREKKTRVSSKERRRRTPSDDDRRIRRRSGS